MSALSSMRLKRVSVVAAALLPSVAAVKTSSVSSMKLTSIVAVPPVLMDSSFVFTYTPSTSTFVISGLIDTFEPPDVAPTSESVKFHAAPSYFSPL